MDKEWHRYNKFTFYKEWAEFITGVQFKELFNKMFKIILNIIKLNYKFLVFMLWFFLLISDSIEVFRLFYLIIIMLLIALYKIALLLIFKINEKINLYKFLNIIIFIHKYKNIIILIIIYIQEKLYEILYYLTKFNIRPQIINLIYWILPNIIILNGLKTVLNKYYVIVLNWKDLTYYDLLFKRLYGMVLSILIFTDVITYVNKLIGDNRCIVIYLLLVILGFLSNNVKISNLFNLNHSIKDLVRLRILSTITGVLLYKLSEVYSNKDQKSFNQLYNKNINIYLGFHINISNVYSEPFELLFKLYKLNCVEGVFWNDYYNKPSIKFYNVLLNSYRNFHNIQDIIYNKHEVPNLNKKNELYMQYQLLIFKLWVFYLWDLEKALNLQNPILQLELITVEEGYRFLTFTYAGAFWDFDNKFYSLQVENVDVFNIKLSKSKEFWNLAKNKNFYKEFYNFIGTSEYRNIVEFDKIYKIYSDKTFFVLGYDDINVEKHKIYLDLELKNLKEVWVLNINKGEDLNLQYNIIFKELKDLQKEMYLEILNKNKI